MKIFYDKDGNVVGFVEGATEEVEANIKMPGTTAAKLDPDLAEQIGDPYNPLTFQDLTIDQQT